MFPKQNKKNINLPIDFMNCSLYNLPLSVRIEAIHVDDVGSIVNVHLTDGVSPVPKHQVTDLCVQRVETDIHLTRTGETATYRQICEL